MAIDKKVWEDVKTILLNKKSLKYFGILSLWLGKEVVICPDMKDDLILSEVKNKTIIFYIKNEHIKAADIIYATVYAILTTLHFKNVRSSGKDKKTFDIATAHVINRSIKEISTKTNQIRIPKNAIYLQEVEDNIPNSTIDEVYNYLLKDKKSPPPEQQSLSSCDVINYNDQTMLNIETYDTASMNGLYDRARCMWASSSSISGKDMLSDNMLIMIEQFLKVNIPWYKLLQNAIYYCVRNGRLYDWSIPNMILRRPKFKLPGQETKSKKRKWVYISFDVSGSISDVDLLQFAGVVIGSRNVFNKMCILYHNTHIIDSKIIENIPTSDSEFFSLISSFKRGGGTSHKAVFDYIEEKKKTEEISSVIFITDYQSDVSGIYRDYTFFNTIPNIWVIKGDEKVDIEGKLVKTIRID